VTPLRFERSNGRAAIVAAMLALGIEVAAAALGKQPESRSS
jgi:hypothetical protein